jgi:RNA polymerase sigma-70 factor, ECF subfamily
VQGRLDTIYRNHRQGLFTLALSITRSSDRAEDAVHDAFARLCRGTTTPTGDPVAYVYATVRNAAIDITRKRTETPVDTSLGGLGPTPHKSKSGYGTGVSAVAGRVSIYSNYDASLTAGPEKAIANETQRAVQQAVEQLPEPQRQVLVMKLYAGLTFDQIAQTRDEPLSTVASRYRRALAKLKGILAQLVEP